MKKKKFLIERSPTLIPVEGNCPFIGGWVAWPVIQQELTSFTKYWDLTESQMSLLSRGLTKTIDKLKKSHLFYNNVYSHQTWLCGDMQWGWGAPTHKVTKSFNHMVLWGYVTNQMCRISTCTRLMTAKHHKVVTYHEKLPPIKLCNPLNTWLTCSHATSMVGASHSMSPPCPVWCP